PRATWIGPGGAIRRTPRTDIGSPVLLRNAKTSEAVRRLQGVRAKAMKRPLRPLNAITPLSPAPRRASGDACRLALACRRTDQRTLDPGLSTRGLGRADAQATGGRRRPRQLEQQQRLSRERLPGPDQALGLRGFARPLRAGLRRRDRDLRRGAE